MGSCLLCGIQWVYKDSRSGSMVWSTIIDSMKHQLLYHMPASVYETHNAAERLPTANCFMTHEFFIQLHQEKGVLTSFCLVFSLSARSISLTVNGVGVWRDEVWSWESGVKNAAISRVSKAILFY